MCVDVRKNCQCGQNNVQFHLRDNLLNPSVIANLYCPECLGPESFDSQTMLSDNNWVIEYDMVLIRMSIIQKLRVDIEDVNPEFVFDQGYASWQEIYPGERDDIKDEKDKIVQLMKEDQKKYLQKIQHWNINRMTDLKSQGWRKAQMT